MSDTDPIEELADTLYDALYAITPYAEPHFADQRQGLRNAVQAILRQAAESSISNADDRIAAIRDRAKAATEGPWERYPEYGPTFIANTTGPYLRGVGDFNFGVGQQAEADEAFVSNARQDVDFLLARVTELEAQLANAQKLVGGWRQASDEHAKFAQSKVMDEHPGMADKQDGRSNQLADCANELADVLKGENPDDWEYGIGLDVTKAGDRDG